MPPIHRTLTIVNERGLHARASAKFVECVEGHNAVATVSRNGETVGGDSIMGLLMLAAAKGSTIEVTCEGEDAEGLMDCLEKMVSTKFGEES